MLATLTHPNIAHIRGIEEGSVAEVGQTGQLTPFLVLELVEGLTLADCIAGGPIPLDEPLAIATQIAEALGARPHPSRAVRLRGAEGRIEFFLHQFLDRVADPLAHRLLDAVATELRNRFLVPWLPGTVLHRVILRHPRPSRRSSLNRNCAG